MSKKTVTVELGGRTLTIETGWVAKQASGTVIVRYGDTVVMVPAVSLSKAKEGLDFFPLTINYTEKFYAGGKIPGGYFKREARPTDRETLISRLIDRPIRPLFPEGYFFETQIMPTVLSMEPDNEASGPAMIGASAALMVSDIPFRGPIAGCRVGRVNGQYIVNPTVQQKEESDIDVFLAASREAVVMVEAGADEVSEEDMVRAIEFGHKALIPVLDAQEQLVREAGKAKRDFTPAAPDSAVVKKVRDLASGPVKSAFAIREKQARYAALDGVKKLLKESFSAEELEAHGDTIFNELENVKSDLMRAAILNEKSRIDGRGLEDIRPITCEVGWLPRTHGSALFTRGETQAVVTATLGTELDEQRIDQYEGMVHKKFLLHYNFPPYSVGEVSNRLAAGRREIGHGALAERALQTVIPSYEEFPYVLRVVSEVTESNGSSSMATICGGTLSLMDAGVPIKAPVAGIAMGLIMDTASGKYAVLSDILGDEDHLGDMDFKVGGTEKGVTALQMDLKVTGITTQIMREALEQARKGRLHILKAMNSAIDKPRSELSKYAPRITSIHIPVDRIRDVIGPGGKVIREITARSGATINIDDSGRIDIASTDQAKTDMAIQMIRDLTREAEIGHMYLGKVRRVTEFGAFVEILPGKDGLVHISHLARHRVDRVEEVVQEGDEILVKVLDIEPGSGKVRLSHKEVMHLDPASVDFTKPAPPPPDDLYEGGDEERSSGERGGDRGGRGGDRGGRGGDRGGRGGDRGGRGGDRGGRGRR